MTERELKTKLTAAFELCLPNFAANLLGITDSFVRRRYECGGKIIVQRRTGFKEVYGVHAELPGGRLMVIWTDLKECKLESLEVLDEHVGCWHVAREPDELNDLLIKSMAEQVNIWRGKENNNQEPNENRLTPEEAYKRARITPEFRPEAERIIEAASNGMAAYWMAKHCGSSREWAERIIQAAGNALIAEWMAQDCGSSREWAEKVGKGNND